MSNELDDTLAAAGAIARSERELAVGELFADRYEVQAKVGEGGMGAVYRVRDVKLEETVALKLLTLEGDEAVARFVAEVRLARRVTHPNVARTHDFGERDGTRFLTMEYVDGTALDEILERRGALDPVKLTEIGAAVADGLGAAHAAGIVHRDLKPANVMIETTGRVVITDFGIAHMGGEAGTRQVVGTPHYMAPEQVVSDPVDGRTDLYALGVVLFELATGTLPFEGTDAISLAAARLHQPPPDPRQRGAVSDALASLILRCLALDPADRPQTAAEVRQALVALVPSDAMAATIQLPASAGGFVPPVSAGGAAGGLPASAGGSTTTPRSLFAPMAPKERALAVLPFVYRGAPDHDYLGEGMAEELIDVLCRTKGLKVLSLGATRRFADDRDPVAMAEQLGAGSVVDGTVQLAGDRVRLAARLVDAEDGEQRWADRFDGRFEDVFALQESMGRRLAEALRVELVATSQRHTTDPRAVELYLLARKKMRVDLFTHPEEAVALLEESLQLAPGFGVAIAAHAMASVRAWWAREGDPDGARAQRAYESVQRAILHVPDLPETHQARAMLAVQDGAFREAAQALHRTLELAPTMTDAHQYLGALQTEAGHLREGRKRLELALELDPGLNGCHLALARVAALVDDREALARHVEALQQSDAANTIPVIVSRFRWASYLGDAATMAEQYRALLELDDDAARRVGQLFSPLMGEGDAQDVRAMLAAVPDWLSNARFVALLRQIATEVLLLLDDRDSAFVELERLAAGMLIDREWLERCTVFDRVRDDPRFVEAHRIVRLRTDEIWRR